MIYRRKKFPQLKLIMIQILNNLRTLYVPRLCANFYQGTLTKGRKKPSLPPMLLLVCLPYLEALWQPQVWLSLSP